MKEQSCLLPLSYWGNIHYFSKLVHGSKIQIEVHENYQKKTYRNRCELYGANGKLSLQVPVERGSFHKTNIQDLKISYDSHWRKNHLKTIQSAYRSTPFYEYYEDDLFPLYETKFDYLMDLDLKILEICKDWIDWEGDVSQTKEYKNSSSLIDYRELIHPKNNYVNDQSFQSIPYIQGFEQRNGFIHNLSILDLLFNLGPESYSLLKQSFKRE